jgi:RNA-binding protein Hfq
MLQQRTLSGRIKMTTDKKHEKKQNLQDVFLNHVRKAKTPLTLYLVNGIKLQGYITWFDNFSILLKRDNQLQLIYKHAVSTIQPNAYVDLFVGDDATENAGDFDD